MNKSNLLKGPLSKHYCHINLKTINNKCKFKLVFPYVSLTHCETFTPSLLSSPSHTGGAIFLTSPSIYRFARYKFNFFPLTIYPPLRHVYMYSYMAFSSSSRQFSTLAFPWPCPVVIEVFLLLHSLHFATENLQRTNFYFHFLYFIPLFCFFCVAATTLVIEMNILG